MKKIIKKICFISVILCISLLFVDNVQADFVNSKDSYRLCKDFDVKKECTGATDDYGDKCMVKKIDGKLKCVPKNCNSYNDIGYGYKDGVLTGCKNDDRCEQKGNICLPKNKTMKYTCEDIGVANNIGGVSNCTSDWKTNTCETYDPNANNERAGKVKKCRTLEKTYDLDKTNFICTDLTTEKECNKNKQDSLNNYCLWDSSKKDGEKCTIISDQDTLNKTADAAKANGTPVEEAVAAAEQKQKEERKKKIAEIIKNKNNTEIVVSEAKYKCSDVKYLTTTWLFIRIAAPFMIVLFGSLDFFKAVAAGDEKKMKESKTNFVKRLIAFLLLILLPFVVQLIFTFMGTYGSNNICLLKCITTNDTSEKGCD